MKKILSAFVLLSVLAAAPAFAAPTPERASATSGRVGIAAVVNDDIITFSDIQDRVKLYMAGSRGTPPPEVLRDAENKVLNRLIDERLQLQEAKSLGIVIGEDQLQGAFASVAEQNKLPPEEFKKRVQSSGVKIATLYDQIRAEIAWGMVARRKLRPQINVSESEIDMEIGMSGNPAPVPAAAPPAEAEPTAAETPATAAETPAQAQAPAQTIVHLKQIVIPVSPEDPEVIVGAKLSRAQSLKSEIATCDQMDAKMNDFTAEGTADLGKGSIDALPAPLKEAAEKLAIGELSIPIRTTSGFAVVMVCSREEIGGNAEATTAPAAAPTPVAAAPEQDAPAPAAPVENTEANREAVANKIGLKRMIQMQERYLRDLRAAAFIEKRI